MHHDGNGLVIDRDVKCKIILNTFEQTLPNFLCLITHPCTVDEVDRHAGLWYRKLSLLIIHN